MQKDVQKHQQLIRESEDAREKLQFHIEEAAIKLEADAKGHKAF